MVRPNSAAATKAAKRGTDSAWASERATGIPDTQDANPRHGQEGYGVMSVTI
jgi:hypothetical protein